MQSTEILDQVMLIAGLDSVHRRSPGRIWFAVSPGGTINELPRTREVPYIDVWIERMNDGKIHLWVHTQCDDIDHTNHRTHDATLEEILNWINIAITTMENHHVPSNS